MKKEVEKVTCSYRELSEHTESEDLKDAFVCRFDKKKRYFQPWSMLGPSMGIKKANTGIIDHEEQFRLDHFEEFVYEGNDLKLYGSLVDVICKLPMENDHRVKHLKRAKDQAAVFLDRVFSYTYSSGESGIYIQKMNDVISPKQHRYLEEYTTNIEQNLQKIKTK